MYAGRYAELNPERPAFVMSNSGTTVSYREYDNRTNQLAHLLRDHGLGRLDHYSIFMENNDRYLECCGAGERAGLYYTCINSYLKDEELAYILNNSESRILITSADKLEVAREALVHCPNIEKCLVAGADGDGGQVVNYEQALSAYSTAEGRSKVRWVVSVITIGCETIYVPGVNAGIGTGSQYRFQGKFEFCVRRFTVLEVFSFTNTDNRSLPS